MSVTQTVINFISFLATILVIVFGLALMAAFLFWDASILWSIDFFIVLRISIIVAVLMVIVGVEFRE